MNRKHIFFDCYQTLLDTDIDRERQTIGQTNGWEVFVGLLGDRYGIHVTATQFSDMLERRKAEYYREHDEQVCHHDLTNLVIDALEKDLKTAIPSEAVSELLYEYRKASRGFARLYPNVKDVLLRLTEHYELSLVSYTQTAFTLPELKELGIDGYFSHFVFSSDIGLRKENIDFYRECLRIVGAEAPDCIMVGDNYHDDIFMPAEVGIRGVWLRNPQTCANDFPSSDASPVPTIDLESFDRLPNIIDGMFS